MIKLAIHGGAGDLDASADTKIIESQRQFLREFLNAGYALLKSGETALTVVERVVQMLEDCPLFNAGIGGVLNEAGEVELDAAIMDGKTLRSGAVAGVSTVRSPIAVSRAIMEQTPSAMLTGGGADYFARSINMETVEPAFFVTELRKKQLEKARRTGAIVLDHDTAFGTVGAVALDENGNLAAATSTGGLTNKRRGRVGDSPITGAGTYANNETCAVSCTGTGEAFMRACLAFDINARIKYLNNSLEKAAADALLELKKLDGRGGLVAIDRNGNVTMPFNSNALFRGWTDDDGAVNVAVMDNDASQYPPQ